MAQVIARTLVLASLVWGAPGVAAAQGTSDAWVQIADSEAQRGNLPAAIEALEKAVLASPANASLYARLSQTYASAGYAKAALRAIEGALVLKPNEPDYIRARATLATWAGDYPGARHSYRQLQAMTPGDPEIALGMARVSAWSGDTNQAVKQYKRYLAGNQSNLAVWLELAKTESWRGNSNGALAAIEAYKSHGGETDRYVAETAAVLASAGRPGKAVELVDGLLAHAPASYDLNLTRAIALASQERPKAARESLGIMRQLAPDRPETRTTERMLRALLSSSAQAPFTIYSDSDNLTVQRFAPRAVVGLGDGTQLSAGYERSHLEARTNSGLEGLAGQTRGQYDHMWAGAAQRFGAITVNGQAGYATTNGAHGKTTYGIGLVVRAADSLRFTLSRASAPLVVSPRTLDLGLVAVAHRAQADWTPTLQTHIVFDASFQELSDGNRRWEVTFSPRQTVARLAGFNLDLGASVYRLESSDDFDHGYYDPRRYEYYAASIYPYLKVRENVGLGVTAALGVQRDNTSPSFHFGGNVGAEATFGIYQPWVVKLNGSATLNGRLDSGAFHGFGAGAALVRRF
jgi:Flp pilus assembly protein TadD